MIKNPKGIAPINMLIKMPDVGNLQLPPSRKKMLHVHVPLLTIPFPLTQRTQSFFAVDPSEALFVPFGQGEHVSLPSSVLPTLYVVTGQLLHLDPYIPGGHPLVIVHASFFTDGVPLDNPVFVETTPPNNKMREPIAAMA